MSKLRSTLPTLALLVLAGGSWSAAIAQNLDMSGTGANYDDGRPKAGMTQNGVEAKYGTPVTKRSAVGDPPITRWEYQDFVVYFEYDKVIHAVLKR